MKFQKNKEKFPLAINILKYQVYNFKLFNCQEVVLYETLVILAGKSFKNKEFFHSTQTIADKTGIKRHSVDKILKKFKELGIIEYQIKGMPNVKYIRVLWDNIMELLPEIYQFDEFKKLFDGTTKPLFDYYKLLAENNKEKNINKNIKEEYKKEIDAKAEAEEHNFFREKIIEVAKQGIHDYNIKNPKTKKDIPSSLDSLSIKNLKYIQALEMYGERDILNAFSKFFNAFLLDEVSISKNIVGYFLKEDKNKFPVIERFLILYLNAHPKSKKHKKHNDMSF